MSKTPNEQPLSAEEQIKQMAEQLKQIKDILEVPTPEFSQDLYSQSHALINEMSAIAMAMMKQYGVGSPLAEQADNMLMEAGKIHNEQINKKYEEYARYHQKEQGGEPQS